MYLTLNMYVFNLCFIYSFAYAFTVLQQNFRLHILSKPFISQSEISIQCIKAAYILLLVIMGSNYNVYTNDTGLYTVFFTERKRT